MEQIEELLTFFLRSNYIRFGEVYHQREGIAMGNNLAPPFAIIFKHDLETSLLQNAPGAPVLYNRYIDDIFMLWTPGRHSGLVKDHDLRYERYLVQVPANGSGFFQPCCYPQSTGNLWTGTTGYMDAA